MKKIMKYDPEKHHRRSIRLKGYDYSQAGAYFVTLCSHNRECIFGEIVNEQMVLNTYGKIVVDEWKRSEKIRNEIELDVFQLMPNHFHCIFWIIKDSDKQLGFRGGVNVGANSNCSLQQTFRMKPKSLSSLMAGFQASVTSKINRLRGTPGKPVWQRNYYEHIVRNDAEINRIRQYIIDNPTNWKSDNANPNNVT